MSAGFFAVPRVIGRTREVPGRTRDGREIAIDLRVMPIKLDGRDCFIGGMRDVTERKAREAALQSLSDRLGNQVAILDAILANIEEAVCLFDAEGKLITCNPRYPALLDLPANVVAPGMTLPELVDLIVGLGIVAADDAPAPREQRLSLRPRSARRQDDPAPHQRPDPAGPASRHAGRPLDRDLSRHHRQ